MLEKCRLALKWLWTPSTASSTPRVIRYLDRVAGLIDKLAQFTQQLGHAQWRAEVIQRLQLDRWRVGSSNCVIICASINSLWSQRLNLDLLPELIENRHHFLLIWKWFIESNSNETVRDVHRSPVTYQPVSNGFHRTGSPTGWQRFFLNRTQQFSAMVTRCR